MTLVSVVIPAFNAEDYLATSIQSVLLQTHQLVDVIVVDNASTDGTPLVTGRFDDPRLRSVEVQVNRGVGRGRNIGAAACEGDLVAFLDADDQWDRTKLEDQIAILNADPRLVALGSLMRYMSPNGRTMGIAGQVIGTSEQALVQSARLMPFPISSLLVRRSAFEAVGGFAEDLSDPNGAWAEDLSFVAEIARKGQIATVPRVLGSYRLHTGSVSARHQAAIARGKRFVRARLAARDRGEELSYEDFSATYRPSLLQRHGDWVQGCYRRAGLNRAIERPAAATAWGALAFACSPRYTTKRLLLQRARVGG